MYNYCVNIFVLGFLQFVAKYKQYDLGIRLLDCPVSEPLCLLFWTSVVHSVFEISPSNTCPTGPRRPFCSLGEDKQFTYVQYTIRRVSLEVNRGDGPLEVDRVLFSRTKERVGD